MNLLRQTAGLPRLFPIIVSFSDIYITWWCSDAVEVWWDIQ